MTDSRSLVFPKGTQCPIRILMLADGAIHFGESDNGFSLSELITKALLPSAMPWEDLIITTARRFDDDDCCADINDFSFDVNPFGIEQYDQVWLFGHLGEDEPGTERPKVLRDSELKVLSQFMNDGGGVFATGDHANLGFAMCGKVPRVKSMRKWCFKFCESPNPPAPGIEDVTRIDTLREGIDPGFQFNDQSDSIPQEIRPKFYPDPNRKGAYAHPLLVNGDFAITVLPDHLHEGECVVPTNLNEVITYGDLSFEEYPPLPTPDPQIRLAPQKVAISTSAGGHLVGDFGDIPPVEPRAFDIIVAYDGQRVMIDGQPIGRVVVDSSFHHFLDINLRGTDSKDPRKRGFYDRCDNPTKDYEAFKKYYRNIATWLCPPNRRVIYYHAMLLDLRFRSPLIEELVPTPKPTYRDYIFTGAVTEKVIAERFSRAEALQCALAVASRQPDDLRMAFSSLVDPWLPAELNVSLTNPLFDSSSLVRLVLGAAMLKIATELPMDPYKASRVLNENRPKKALSEVISQGVSQSFQELYYVLEQLGITANKLQKVLPKTA